MRYWLALLVILIIIFFIMLMIYSLYEPLDDVVNSVERRVKEELHNIDTEQGRTTGGLGSGQGSEYNQEQLKKLMMFTYGMGIINGRSGTRGDVPDTYTGDAYTQEAHDSYDGPTITEVHTGRSETCGQNDKEQSARDDMRSDWTVFKGPVCNERKCGKLSKGEKETKESLKRIFGKRFYTTRPDFLKNPKTKRNLELDCYNHDLAFAVEYNGRQHYEYPNGFHRDEKTFRKQIERDEFKRGRCDDNGIFLLSIPWTVSLCDIESYIRDSLPKTLKRYVVQQ